MSKPAAKEFTVGLRKKLALNYNDKEINDMRGINLEYLEGLHTAFSMMQKHAEFTNISEQSPLTIAKKSTDVDGNHGHMAAFNKTDFHNALATRGIYECGANVFWLAVFYLTTPGMPMSRGGVEYLKQFFLSETSSLKDSFPGHPVVYVNSDNADEFLALAQAGQLKNVAPEELVHAFVFRLAKAIEDKNDTDIKYLKRMALSTGIKIYKVDNLVDARFFFRQNAQIRENIGAKFVALYPTAVMALLTWYLLHHVIHKFAFLLCPSL